MSHHRHLSSPVSAPLPREAASVSKEFMGSSIVAPIRQGERSRENVEPPFGERSARETRQPFREEFVKMQESQKAMPQVLPERKLTPLHLSTQANVGGGHVASLSRTAPLSHLKSQPKKDKGPSTENLSSLRTLLDAAFSGGREAEAPKKASPITPPEHVEKTPSYRPPAPPPSLLGDASPASGPKEIPEDVLRNVLAD